MKKAAKIKDYIGVYDGFVTKVDCEKAIAVYEDQEKLNKTLNRMASENQSILAKQDKQFFAGGHNIDVWWEDLKPLVFNFDIAWQHYANTTGAAKAYNYDGKDFKYTNIKIQKTLPTEGYHIWHVEHGVGHGQEPRAFVFSVYLNDVKDGGETEFLNFSQRVEPKTGRIVIWPAGFPYVHRGNPPLKGTKYILTSWMMLR